MFVYLKSSIPTSNVSFENLITFVCPQHALTIQSQKVIFFTENRFLTLVLKISDVQIWRNQ